MTISLSDTQSLFQDRLLTGAPGIKDHLVGGGPFLKVYDEAYKARLFEVMTEDFPAVHTLLGDEGFKNAVNAYLDAYPSKAKSIRWIGRHFSGWLKEGSPWSGHPMVADMAAFEWALGIAFDTPDEPPLAVDDLSAVPPEAWPHLTFEFHPSLTVPSLTFDVAPFQQAVAGERDPAIAPQPLDGATAWAVWRDPEELIVRYRPLNEDEALGLERLRNGGTFVALCEALAESGDADNAALRAAGYLRNWIEAGWITAFGGIPMSWQNPES